MLTEQTLEKLRNLKLKGMAKGFEEQLAVPDVMSMSFDDRFGLLVDREEGDRNDRRFQGRMRLARLRENACIEGVDFSPGRGMDKSVLLSLAACSWVKGNQNILITGPTGVGKTYLACALAHKACLEGFTSRYVRVPRLFQDLAIAKADGSYRELMADYAKVNVLILDDWGLATMNDEQRRDLLEIAEDRYSTRSTIITSQIPVENWFDVIGEPTVADAIMDRLIHRAHKLALKGPSKRKEKIILDEMKALT